MKVNFEGLHYFTHVKFLDKKETEQEVTCSRCGITGTHKVNASFVEVKQTRKNKAFINDCKPEMQTQRVVLELAVKFTDEQISDFGKKLAEKIFELGKLEVDKKANADVFKGQIETVHSEITDLSGKINKGEEDMDIDCEVKYHFPAKDMKTVTRLDTNELVGEFAMVEEDFNLFTQYDEKVTELNPDEAPEDQG